MEVERAHGRHYRDSMGGPPTGDVWPYRTPRWLYHIIIDMPLLISTPPIPGVSFLGRVFSVKTYGVDFENFRIV